MAEAKERVGWLMLLRRRLSFTKETEWIEEWGNEEEEEEYGISAWARERVLIPR